MLVLFVCKDLSPLYKSSNTRNHLKPENLETLFLLSTLKMPITSVTSYKEKIKILRRRLTLLWFLDFATVYSYFNIQLCSYLMLEIKFFVSLKNESYLFWTRVQFKGGVKLYLDTLENTLNLFDQRSSRSINPFHTTDLWFSDVFRGYQKRSVAWNGLLTWKYFCPFLWLSGIMRKVMGHANAHANAMLELFLCSII